MLSAGESTLSERRQQSARGWRRSASVRLWPRTWRQPSLDWSEPLWMQRLTWSQGRRQRRLKAMCERYRQRSGPQPMSSRNSNGRCAPMCSSPTVNTLGRYRFLTPARFGLPNGAHARCVTWAPRHRWRRRSRRQGQASTMGLLSGGVGACPQQHQPAVGGSSGVTRTRSRSAGW